MSGDEFEGCWLPSDQFGGVYSVTHGRTWTGCLTRAYKTYRIGTHDSQEHAAKARDMLLYKLDGPESKGFQVGLTEEERRALDRLSLEQLLEELMRCKLDCQRGLSKYHGVRPREGERWQAQFRLGEVELSGSFFGEDQAARAYDGFALYAGGRDTITNFDDYTPEQLTDICEARTADAAANAAIAAGGIVLPAGKQHRRRGKQKPKAKATAGKDDPLPGASSFYGNGTDKDAGPKAAQRQKEAPSTPAGAGAE